MLWVDKYRPRSLDKLVVHSDLGENLQKLVASGDIPHLLFYGPSGAGKKTLVLCLLRELYGPGVEKMKVETRPWKIELPSRKLDLELTTVSSSYHVELNPSDVGGHYDRYVVQEVIKEMARNRPLDKKGFKVLVLDEVDRLSKDAQHSLRRTMEKYSGACRLLMTCSNASRVIEPLRSRCLAVRVPAPSLEDVVSVLQNVAKKESVALPSEFAACVAADSSRNMRRALLSLEVSKLQQYPFIDGQPVQRMDWELYLAEVAADILAEQTPKRLLLVRGKLYELLVNCIPPELILRTLLHDLLRKLDDELKHKVTDLAAEYEARLQQGSKPIFHLEAFVAQFMSAYKQWTISAFG